MSIFLYWGEDEFALEKAVKTLTDSSLDPNWSSFNLDKISPDQTDGVIQALNQAMTPPFGFGSRLVWLVNTTICQQCSDQLLRELERTLPNIPDSTVLLLTTPNKPDGRLKSTKLLQKYAQFKEFAVIPPWKTELLIQLVQEVATEKQVKMTTRA
ncbi:MAG TPA: DNA polymerase III subunit delta, partial [Allocoleopsis sp.]